MKTKLPETKFDFGGSNTFEVQVTYNLTIAP
jgi:hypothetical protein